MIKGDCLSLVQAFRAGADEWNHKARFVLQECRHFMDLIPIISLDYAPRKANVVAHNLARYAQNVREETVWFEDYPQCISHDVRADMPV